MEESSSPVAFRMKNVGSCIEQALDRLLTIFSKKRFHAFRAIGKRIVSQLGLVPEQPGGGQITCMAVEDSWGANAYKLTAMGAA